MAISIFRYSFLGFFKPILQFFANRYDYIGLLPSTTHRLRSNLTCFASKRDQTWPIIIVKLYTTVYYLNSTAKFGFVQKLQYWQLPKPVCVQFLGAQPFWNNEPLPYWWQWNEPVRSLPRSNFRAYPYILIFEGEILHVYYESGERLSKGKILRKPWK